MVGPVKTSVKHKNMVVTIYKSNVYNLVKIIINSTITTNGNLRPSCENFQFAAAIDPSSINWRGSSMMILYYVSLIITPD